MKRQIIAVLLVFFLLLTYIKPVAACDRKQSEDYITQILFGSDAVKYKSDDDAKILMSALYLCSEQSGNLGEDDYEYLKKQKVKGIPKFKNIKIDRTDLLKYSHSEWETNNKKKSVSDKQENRKKVLTKSVNKVCNAGFLKNIFNQNDDKCENFAKFLYYTHILCDYMANDKDETCVALNNDVVPSFEGESHIDINGGRPQFSYDDKKSTEYFAKLSALDSKGRAGVAYANISKEKLPEANSRQKIGDIRPSGWNQKKYEGLVTSKPPYLYNRCHLIAHELLGVDTKENLITGTRYLNEAMIESENKVCNYVKNTGNHVLYRATPVYKGDNLVASGIQLEAYSVEDRGEGISFNIYLYNVQPGVDINYDSGKNKRADKLTCRTGIIPFAKSGASEKNPDLVYEIEKCLQNLFKDTNENDDYNRMLNELKKIADEARNVTEKYENVGKQYIMSNKCAYEYYNTLQKYIPNLLKKDSFFKPLYD